MNPACVSALWQLVMTTSDTVAQEWAAVASGRGATAEDIDVAQGMRQTLARASVQTIGGNE